MELRHYTTLLWRWFWFILLIGILAGGTAYYINTIQPPIYKAKAILLVSEGSQSVSDNYNSILMSERLAQSYVERLSNFEVLSQSIENLGVNMTPGALKRSMTVNLLRNTQLIELSIEHTEPQVASRLANEIPHVFSERNLTQQTERFATSKASLEAELTELQVELAVAESNLTSELEKPIGDQKMIDVTNDNLLRLRETYARLLQSYEDIRIAEASSLNNIIIDEYARAPQVPISPRVTTNTILATAVGLLLAVSLIFVIDYLDDTLKNPEDIEIETGLNPLGVIKRTKVKKPADALVVALDPRSPAAEAYRQVRTNIQFIGVNQKFKSILITSPNVGDGKSTIATNLAAALAQSGKRVILVDADMRRPTLHNILEVTDKKGLSDLIVRGREDNSFIKGTLIHNLLLLPAGRIPPNPAELLGSERMKQIVAWLEEQADHVIFDSPPILAVTDAAILSTLVDTTLVVVSASQTRLPAFIEAIKKLQSLESNIAGVLLNKVNPKRNNGYYYYYRPSDEYSPRETSKPPKSWKQRLGLSA
jgi:non-specific protein-tyrosine kinase